MSSSTRQHQGFTIIEVLLATVVLALILVLTLSSISHVSRVWMRSNDKINSFQEARLAFETITRTLSQATLNTYLDYDSPTAARRYIRKSDLKFFSGPAGTSGIPGTPGTGQAIFFQGPLGYSGNTTYGDVGYLLNTCGYYVDLTTNSSAPAHTSSAATQTRYRLMQLLVPTENNTVYSASGHGWFLNFTAQTRPIAENVVALIVRPQDPATVEIRPLQSPNDSYEYDSTIGTTSNPQPITSNQLPPIIHVTLIAIDERSALRVEDTPSVISSIIQGKFSDPENYEADLESTISQLANANISFRIFSSAVPIRESKWTK